MRKTISLTGKKKITANKYVLDINNAGETALLVLSLTDGKWFSQFPENARLFVHIAENKNFEIADFGTINKPSATYELPKSLFSAPKCSLRIVSTDASKNGVILASSASRTTGAALGGRDGIICFMPADISPRVWKLEIRDDDCPVVYMNEKIPDPAAWACKDPVFVSTVLPTVLEFVWLDIFLKGGDSGVDWVESWIAWADILMPGENPPFKEDQALRQEWIDSLVNSFAHKHKLSGRLLKTFRRS